MDWLHLLSTQTPIALSSDSGISLGLVGAIMVPTVAVVAFAIRAEDKIKDESRQRESMCDANDLKISFLRAELDRLSREKADNSRVDGIDKSLISLSETLSEIRSAVRVITESVSKLIAREDIRRDSFRATDKDGGQ